MDITTLQQRLHAMTQRRKKRVKRTAGAFGGCTKTERMLKRIRRRFDK